MRWLPSFVVTLLVASVAWSQEPPTCELDRSFFDVCEALWVSCGAVPSVDPECQRFAAAFMARPKVEATPWETTACVPEDLSFPWLRGLSLAQRVCVIAGSKLDEKPNCVDSQCRRARAIRACGTGVGCNDPGPYIVH